MSLRDDLLQMDTLRRKTIKVEGVTLTVQEMTGAQRDVMAEAYFAARKPDPGNPGGFIQTLPKLIREMYIVHGVIDPKTGKRVFLDEDAEALSNRHSQRFLDTVSEAVSELSQMDSEAVEEALGNLQSVPSSATGSS